MAFENARSEIEVFEFGEDGSLNLIETARHITVLLHSMAFSPDGHHLFTASHSSLIHHDLDTGQNTPVEGHICDTVWSVAVSPDGKIAASVSKQVVTLWNLETLREVVGLDWPEQRQDCTPVVCFEGAGRYLVAADIVLYGDREKPFHLRIWEAPSFEEIASAKPLALFPTTPSDAR